jgi:hypothetical protein
MRTRGVLEFRRAIPLHPATPAARGSTRSMRYTLMKIPDPTPSPRRGPMRECPTTDHLSALSRSLSPARVFLAWVATTIRFKGRGDYGGAVLYSGFEERPIGVRLDRDPMNSGGCLQRDNCIFRTLNSALRNNVIRNI